VGLRMARSGLNSCGPLRRCSRNRFGVR